VEIIEGHAGRQMNYHILFFNIFFPFERLKEQMEFSVNCPSATASAVYSYAANACVILILGKSPDSFSKCVFAEKARALLSNYFALNYNNKFYFHIYPSLQDGV